MKNIRRFFVFFILFLSAVEPVHAQQDLNAVLSLLQAKTRTAAQERQVINLFASSRNSDTVFAAGASLVRLPPARAQEAKFFNIVIKDSDPLKKIFSAVILTAMGGMHDELSPLLKDALSSQDSAVRSYAAAAYTILNPSADYADYIVNLYIYDAAFAQRAMNLLAEDEKQTLKYLKNAAKAQDPLIRACAAQWLGDLQSENAAKQLLKMAKSERDMQAAGAVAAALAKNAQWTLKDAAKGLKTDYNAPQAATYALALGFMTGQAAESVKQGLMDKDLNVRINSARAAAYMAGVLSSADAALYSNDKDFDTGLLKGLIAPLTLMFQKDEPSVKPYADRALKQIAKLI